VNPKERILRSLSFIHTSFKLLDSNNINESVALFYPNSVNMYCELDTEDFEERTKDKNVGMFVKGFTTDPIDVMVNGPEDDLFTN